MPIDLEKFQKAEFRDLDKEKLREKAMKVGIFKHLAEMFEGHTGLSSTDLAAWLKVRGQTISQWKTGTNRRTPPLGLICDLAEALDKMIIIKDNQITIVSKPQSQEEAVQ
jgi:DNA-binding XRE family transcriptional regulator